MSKGLCPSKSTVYVSNLPFSLTNNDIHKIFEKYGKVVKVTVLKDKERRSRGVAFVLFLDRESAQNAVRALHKSQMFERTVNCTIAKDNGRAPEFIRRREYKDKSKCYECGDAGHLSYRCTKNLFGEREPPPKKKKTKKGQTSDDRENEDSENGSGSGTDDGVRNSLSVAIQFQHQKIEEEAAKYALGEGSTFLDNDEPRRKRYKKDAYFSDEEELDAG